MTAVVVGASARSPPVSTAWSGRRASSAGRIALLLPIGWTAASDVTTSHADVAERLVRTNFLSVAAIVTALLPELRKKPRACVVGFGSVAASRGRGGNLTYAASKRALQTWFEGLRHACVCSAVRVRFYVLGYLDTCLAFGRHMPCRGRTPRGLRLV